MKHLRLIERGIAGIYRAAGHILPAGYAPPPIYYFLLLTFRCNAACPFCFQRSRSQGADEPILPRDRVRALVAQIPRWALVSFSGGEPLCHPEAIAILAETARTHRVSLVTNGLLLDETRIRALVGLAPRRLTAPGLSVIGLSVFEPASGERPEDALTAKRALLAALGEARRRAGVRYPLIDLKLVVRAESVALMEVLLDWVRQGLADVVTYQVQSGVRYEAYEDAEPPERLAAGRWPEPAKRPEFAGLDARSLREIVNAIRSSDLARAGRVRFYPDISTDEMIRYFEGRSLNRAYRCSFPWSGMMVSPLGRAFQCRNPEFEDLARVPLRAAWNGPNFRAFRRLVARADPAAVCAGCCFLDPA